MGRKISLYLILGLVLVGFIVAPVAASGAGVLPNGDFFYESDGNYAGYYHSDTGIWDITHPSQLWSQGLTIPSIPKVTPSYTNSYSNSLLPRTNPSPIITKPLPTHGTIKTIPAVKYVPAPFSFVPYPQKTLTDSDITCAICTPIKLELTNNESDYPLFIRAATVGDIYYLVVDVNSKIKSKVESYFIQVTRAEYCAEDPTTILLGGWVYPDKMNEVSALDGVSMSLMGWPPYGYSDTTLYPPWVSWGVCGDQVTKLNDQFTKPSQNIIRIPQTGVKSSGASRFIQFIK